MKFFLILLACVTLAALTFADIRGEIKGQIENWHNKCQENPKSRLDDATIEKYKKGENVDDGHNIAEHARCMVTEMGLMEEDGTVDPAKIKKKLVEKAKNPAHVDQLVDDCAKNEETPEKTAVHMLRCIKSHIKAYAAEHH